MSVKQFSFYEFEKLKYLGEKLGHLVFNFGQISICKSHALLNLNCNTGCPNKKLHICESIAQPNKKISQQII